MSPENFQLALQIITTNNRINVSFNTPVTDNYSNVHQLLIHESNATVIDKLIENGFSVSMCAKGLSVNKY